jgi:hypothetical protein
MPRKIKVNPHPRKNTKGVKPHSRTVKGTGAKSGAGKELAAIKKPKASILEHKPDSSHLRNVKYNTDTKEMTIQFANKQKYSYANVERKHFTGLKKAKSAGNYFHHNIRTSYEYKKL